MFDEIIAVRSGGDIGTAVAHKLHRSGFRVLILEISEPMAIRRKVAFSEAVFDGQAVVEDVKCRKVSTIDEIKKMWDLRIIPLIVDETGSILKELNITVLVDAILAKKNMNTSMNMAPITIGLGPGFTAGKDVHAVIETNRGNDLGRIIFEGEAEKNTGIPGSILGFTEERVLRAPCEGAVRVIKNIGEFVKKDGAVMYVGEEPVLSRIDGAVRGCIRDGVMVFKGMKIGDVDPRGTFENCYTISDKARCIAGGVLEAVLYFKNCTFSIKER